MATEEQQLDRNVDELSSRLNDGLKCCRSVVSNYRALLGSAVGPPQAGNDDFRDHSGGQDLASQDR